MNIEEFVNNYLQVHRHDVLLNPYNGLVEFAKVFQRKMLEDAVEGYVNYYEDSGGILMAEVQVGCPYHSGDKVRVIVLPKED